MKDETKRAKALAALAALGIETAEVVDKPRHVSAVEELEAEGILEYYNTRGQGYREKECKYCNKIFAVDIKCCSYCSNTCRAKSLQDIGIQWNFGKSESERWGYYRPPKIVSPTALLLLKSIIAESDSELAVS